MILSIFYGLIMIFSVFQIGQTPFVTGAVATGILTGINLLFENWLPDLSFSGYISDLMYWVTLRGLGYLVKVYGRVFLNWVTFDKVHSFVELVVRSLDLATYITILYCIWFSFSFLLWAIMAFSSFWSFIIVFLLLLPFWIIGFAIIAHGVLDLAGFFLFGFPLGSVPVFRNLALLQKYLKMLYNQFKNFINKIENFESFIIYLTSLFTYSSVQLARLPVELIALITVDKDEEPKIRHFWLRFFFGWILFISHLLNLPGLIVAMAEVFVI